MLREAGIAPLVLEAKEGLALINGTQLMASLGTLALLDAERLCVAADVAGAMSLEALKGSSAPVRRAAARRARPHPGQRVVANNLRALLADSEIAESHRDCGKVQDAYSLRCMPQVHGASRDALAWVRSVLEREVNSITDNPSVFVDRGETEIISGGNFHGQPLALALDLAAMATAELANISERRVEQLVNPALSTGLTPFLAAGSGLHSGFMIAQVDERVAREREQDPLPPRERRLDPVVRRQGGPRLDGQRQREEAPRGRRRTCAPASRSRS